MNRLFKISLMIALLSIMAIGFSVVTLQNTQMTDTASEYITEVSQEKQITIDQAAIQIIEDKAAEENNKKELGLLQNNYLKCSRSIEQVKLCNDALEIVLKGG